MNETFRGPDRIRQLDNLETRLMVRVSYYGTCLQQAIYDQHMDEALNEGGDLDLWLDVGGVKYYTASLDRLRRVLGRVRQALGVLLTP